MVPIALGGLWSFGVLWDISSHMGSTDKTDNGTLVKLFTKLPYMERGPIGGEGRLATHCQSETAIYLVKLFTR